MTTKTLKGIIGLIGAGALVMAAFPAAAIQIVAPVYTDPTLALGTLSDQMVLFKNGGVGAGSWFITEPAENPGLQLFELNHGAANPAPINGPLVLLENDGTWSDIVGVTIFGTVGFISSDALANPATHATALALFVNPALFNTADEPLYAIDLNGPGLGFLNAGYTGYFQSDVPDGGLTLALLGFGLMGVEVLRRKLVKVS